MDTLFDIGFFLLLSFFNVCILCFLVPEIGMSKFLVAKNRMVISCWQHVCSKVMSNPFESQIILANSVHTLNEKQSIKFITVKKRKNLLKIGFGLTLANVFRFSRTIPSPS